MESHVPDIGVVWQTAPGPMSAKLTPYPHYFSRSGFPIDIDHWSELAGDREYKVIAQTPVTETMWVSTVWLGLDHAFGGSVPIIFETMVFDEGEVVDNEMYRYATEEAAYAGHEEMVLLMRSEHDWRSA